jgi:hypothetical protein
VVRFRRDWAGRRAWGGNDWCVALGREDQQGPIYGRRWVYASGDVICDLATAVADGANPKEDPE